MKKEQWKQIEGYEGRYEVSDLGRVRNALGNIIRAFTRGGGYRAVHLCKDGEKRKYSVHRLVARAFVGDPTGREINHKDGHKWNNIATNIEICDRSHNMRHAYRNGLIRVHSNGYDKSVNVLTLGGHIIGHYTSIRSLCRALRYDRTSVRRVIRGEVASYKGLKFALA